MDMAFRVALLGAAAAVTVLLIKKSNPEIALLLSTAVVVCIASAALRLAGAVSEIMGEAERLSGLSSAIFSPVVKCVGIGIAAKIGADLCRDASQSGIAGAVEMTGALAAVYTSLPLISTLMKMIGEML